MFFVRDLFRSVRAVLYRKIGACPRCMASSIVGSGLSWLALVLLYAVWPNRLALTFGLLAAAAFTVLAITHVVTHMFRAAPILRRRALNQGKGAGASRSGPRRSRREFALAVAQSGFSFAAAAMLSVPLLPRRAEAAATRTYALYCVGKGCASQSWGGLSVQCFDLGLRYGSQVSVPCGKTAATSLVCIDKGCTLTLELLNATCGGETAPVLSLLNFKCTAA